VSGEEAEAEVEEVLDLIRGGDHGREVHGLGSKSRESPASCLTNFRNLFRNRIYVAVAREMPKPVCLGQCA